LVRGHATAKRFLGGFFAFAISFFTAAVSATPGGNYILEIFPDHYIALHASRHDESKQDA